LGTLGGTFSTAFGVNNNGQIVGQSQTATGRFTSFLYTNGAMTEIGGDGNARAINDLGHIVGETFNGSNFHAYLYKNGSMVDLGTLPGDTNSVATAINSSGEIVGQSSSSNRVRAFVYTGGVMKDIGSLGGNFTSATDINNRGEIVGTSSTPPNSNTAAFLYTTGIMKNLNRIVQPRGANFIISPNGINDKGEIVGFCSFNSQFHACLLKPSR
jgi:probable HAF family extracellular repeat protein